MRRPRSCLCKCLLAHCAFWRMFASAQHLERTSQRSTRSKTGQPRAHTLSYTASPTGSQSRHASVILRVIARCACAMHLQLGQHGCVSTAPVWPLGSLGRRVVLCLRAGSIQMCAETHRRLRRNCWRIRVCGARCCQRRCGTHISIEEVLRSASIACARVMHNGFREKSKACSQRSKCTAGLDAATDRSAAEYFIKHTAKQFDSIVGCSRRLCTCLEPAGSGPRATASGPQLHLHVQGPP